MSLKQVIDEIFHNNTTYLHAQQVLNQACSLKSLSNDLYTDPLRFVYELVQNCDDACQPKSILRIAIVDHRYLIISHNGKAFTEDDVRSLCDVGCSTKGQDKQKTGYKGLGFKAVFGKSDLVFIRSQEKYFRFEANSKAFKWNSNWGRNQADWEQRNKRKFEYPWQICPIWTERDEVPEVIQKWFTGQLDGAATIIHLKHMEETRAAINELTEQPNVFMFLRNIKTVRFSFDSSSETILSINSLRDGSVQIVYKWKPISHWLLYSCEVPVPDNTRHDSRLPEKLQNAKTTEIILAAKIDKNDNIESVQGRHNALFAYLPTKITAYNLPIVVNANFLTNASREHIHTDSLWNQFIFSSIPYEMLKWIGKLMKQNKWSEKALHLIPNPIPVNDNLAKNYNDNCPKAVENIPFLLDINKKPLKISEAVIDITGFSNPDCIGNDLIRNFIIDTFTPTPHLALYPFIPNSNRVRKFKILIFHWEHCFEMLNSENFQSNFTTDQNIQFIAYLFNEYGKQTQNQTRLRQIPFIMDCSGILQVTNNIYLPSQFSNTDWSTSNDTDPYIHHHIMSWLKTKLPVLNWLKSLGIMEKTDEMFVRRKIIPNVRNYTTLENSVPTVRKLFTSFQHGHIGRDILQQLNKLKLLSEEGTLVPADELYFSDIYLPRLSLSNFHLDKASFLSSIYLTELKGPVNKMKEFFLLFGVQEDIKLIRFNEDQRNELVAAYRFKQTETLLRFNSLIFQHCLTLPFLAITQNNYDFSLYFWQHIIHSINPTQLNESEVLICDQQSFRKVDNLPYWFVRSRACIPTTTKQLLKSTDVFSNDLRSIAGDFLPIFACITNTPFPLEWQRFFQFKTQLSIPDHIQLLNLIYDRSKTSSLNDENETCIQRVYTSLMKCLSKLDRKQLDQNRPKPPFYLLSIINNEFRPSTDLVISLSKDFILPNHIPQIKLSTGNARDTNLSYFLEFFNIRQIGINDLLLPLNLNPQPSLILRAKLRDMQAHLFELVHSRNINDHRIDHDLEIFEVERLELFYNGIIPILQLNIHVMNNQIYITRPWNSKEVMSKLPQILCKQFKLPLNMDSDIHEFLLTEQNTSSTMPLTLDPSIDLLRIEGTRAKFAMLIDRDNEQLFNHLSINDTIDPADLLIKGLHEQHSSFDGYIYHYTHLENAVSIIRNHCLKSRNNLTPDEFKDSSARHITQTTRDEIKDYSRFYFRPLTPIQYINENLGLFDRLNRYGNQPMCPVPIFFCIDLHEILKIENLQWKISLGNLASPQTEYDNTINIIKKFDFCGVYGDIRTERGRYSSQQEFLIKSQLNFDQLKPDKIKIICPDENIQHSLQSMITHNYSSIIDKAYYYGLNSRVVISPTSNENEIMVFINGINSLGVNGQLILQLSGDDTNRTIQGNLQASFQRGTLSTVYSNQQLLFKADFNHVRYGIYYEYENQIWLIHTNSSEPSFIKPV